MISSSPRPSDPKRGTWLLVALVLVVAVLGGAWVWLGLDSAQNGAHPTAPHDLAVRAPDADAPLAAAHDEEPAASDDIAAPDAAGRTRAVPDPAAATPVLWLEGVIRGRVLGGPGATEPFQGIAVRATSPRSRVVIPERRTTTDAQGRFVLRGLAAATWNVEASAPESDKTGSVTVDIDEKHPLAEVDVLIPFERHLNVVFIDPRGQPVRATTLGLDPALLPLLCVGLARTCREPGTILTPADAPLNRCLDRSAKGERNTWEVVIQSNGADCVHALYGDRVITGRALAPADQRVEIVIDAVQLSRLLGTCAIRVFAADSGAPIGLGQVQFRLPAGVVLRRALDEGGAAFAAGCPMGTLEVRVESPGFAPRTVEVTLPGNAVTRVELVRARSIGGRVVLETGSDPRRFVPELWRVVDPAAALNFPRTRAARSDETGHFAFEGLEPGVYVVAAVAASVAGRFSANDVLAGRAAGAAWVDLTLGDAPDVLLQVPAWLR